MGTENVAQQITNGDFSCDHVAEKTEKEFNVLQLIDGYRTRGHLFTKTNPVRDRRTYTPTLALENFGLIRCRFRLLFLMLLRL